MKRVVVISDLHGGHRSGLTSPIWWMPKGAPGELGYFALQQREVWGWYAGKLQELQPIDVLVVNGDAIDGPGKKSGGTELITTDMRHQCMIAADCIKEAKAKEVHIVAGTPYHTSPDGDDWEAVLADMVGAASFRRRLYLNVEGVVFDFKHKVSGSTVPHGRSSAIKKDALWSAIWADHYKTPRGNVLVRSHVHYYDFNGNRKVMGVVTPALQSWGSKYGEAQCMGIVDIGLIHFDVENGAYGWQGHFFDPDTSSLLVESAV